MYNDGAFLISFDVNNCFTILTYAQVSSALSDVGITLTAFLNPKV